jgi:hypothetical protein
MSKAGGSTPNSDELATYLNNSGGPIPEGSPLFQYVDGNGHGSLEPLTTVSSGDYWMTPKVEGLVLLVMSLNIK